jgi:hypothetical protein
VVGEVDVMEVNDIIVVVSLFGTVALPSDEKPEGLVERLARAVMHVLISVFYLTPYFRSCQSEQLAV